MINETNDLNKKWLIKQCIENDLKSTKYAIDDAVRAGKKSLTVHLNQYSLAPVALYYIETGFNVKHILPEELYIIEISW